MNFRKELSTSMISLLHILIRTKCVHCPWGGNYVWQFRHIYRKFSTISIEGRAKGTKLGHRRIKIGFSDKWRICHTWQFGLSWRLKKSLDLSYHTHWFKFGYKLFGLKILCICWPNLKFVFNQLWRHLGRYHKEKNCPKIKFYKDLQES